MYSYRSSRRDYQKEELLKWLEDQVKAGRVINRDHYAQMARKLFEGLNEDSKPVSKNTPVAHGDVISSMAMDKFFRDYNADLQAAFKEASETGATIKRRLKNNKRFYNEIKGDISSLTKSLGLQRSKAHGGYGSDQNLFVETFQSPIDFRMYDTIIDGKTGQLRLSPTEIKKTNRADNIDNIEVTVYPVHNDAGGVYHLTRDDRDLEINYSSGPRDMLQNGTWELQILASKDIELFFNNRKHSGAIAVIDIQFETNSRLNYIQYDPLGKYEQEILYIKYKDSLEGEWKWVLDANGDAIHGSSNDLIEFINFTPINPIALRIVVKQDDNDILTKDVSNFSALKSKLEDDITSTRFGTNRMIGQDDYTATYPDSDSEGNMYEMILSDIERATSVDHAFDILKSYLDPQKDQGGRLSNKRLYTLGFHSVDLESRGYKENHIGIYYSHNPNDTSIGYKVDTSKITKTEVSLLPTRVTLESKDSKPGSSTVEYKIIDANNTIEIPIMATNDDWYREPAQFIRSQYNNMLAIQLTFPISLYGVYTIKLFCNGEQVDVNLTPVNPTNSINLTDTSSRQFIVDGINPSTSDIYVVEYQPAFLDTCIAWVIDPGNNPTNSRCIAAYPSMIFANKKLTDKEIRTHGSGCLCKAKPTYIKIYEWNNWGIVSDGVGSGYTTSNTNVPPIPKATRRREAPGR